MIDRVTIGLELPDSNPEIRISSLSLNWQQNDRRRMIDAYRALEAAEAPIDRRDDHPQYLGMLGGIHYRPGYHRKAIETYERLLATVERRDTTDLQQRREGSDLSLVF